MTTEEQAACLYMPDGPRNAECRRPADYRLVVEGGLWFSVCERCARLVEQDIMEHGSLIYGRKRSIERLSPPPAAPR